MGEDHPRSRGEYQAARISLYWREGSSPLSRGIPAHGSIDRVAVRIIPALAGNTCHTKRREWNPQDHPRSRGEYILELPLFLLRKGSSPLSRGIPGKNW